MSWLQSVANKLPAAIDSWWIKLYGDDAYYNLFEIKDGKAVAKSVTDTDSKKRKHGKSIDLVFTGKIMRTDKTKLLKLLPAMVSGFTDHIITTVGGTTFSSANLAEPFFGLHWKFTVSKDMDVDRYVEIRATRRISRSDWDELIAAAPAVGTQDAGDGLYALATLPKSSIYPSGLKHLLFGNPRPIPVTVETGDDTLVNASMPDVYSANDPVKVYSTGDMPAPLVEGTTYYIKTENDPGSSMEYTLSATPGGTLIDLTSIGSGQVYLMPSTGVFGYNTIFRNGELTLDLKVTKDQYGRETKQGQVDVMASIECLQTSATELADLSGGSGKIDDLDLDWEVRLQDDTLISFDANELGAEWEYGSNSDSDDNATIKLEAQGAVKLSSLAGMIS
jgi:hypothetical protein